MKTNLESVIQRLSLSLLHLSRTHENQLGVSDPATLPLSAPPQQNTWKPTWSQWSSDSPSLCSTSAEHMKTNLESVIQSLSLSLLHLSYTWSFSHKKNEVLFLTHYRSSVSTCRTDQAPSPNTTMQNINVEKKSILSNWKCILTRKYQTSYWIFEKFSALPRACLRREETR